MEEIQQAPSGPKTSVLIVSHNAVDALRCCLEALLRTTDRQEVEILVVDKGSRDGSQQLDAEFAGVTFLRLPRNFGYTKAVNIGTRTAAGDYLLLLDPHVEVEPGVVAGLSAQLDADSTAIAVCPLLVNEGGQAVSRFRKVPAASGLLRIWKTGNDESVPAPAATEGSVHVEFPLKAAVMVRKQFVKGMNYLDERYGEAGSDAELFYQIQHANRKVLLLPGLKAVYRPVELRLPEDAEAQLSADEALAACAYAGKHGGIFAKIGVWLGALLHVFVKLITFQRPGYQMSRLVAIASFQKIDGTQASI